MNKLSVLLFVLSVAIAAAHEWTSTNKANPEEIISLHWALRQQNLDKLEETLFDVADPASSNYGQWWSASEILDLVAPPQEVSNSVAAFLKAHGAINVINQRDVLISSIKVKDANTLLNVDFHNFLHRNGKSKVTRSIVGSYVVPAEIAQHIQLVAGAIEFPLDRDQHVRSAAPQSTDAYVIPETVQKAYKLPATFKANAKSSLCLAEFQNDASYNPTDLTAFAKQTATPAIEVTHKVGPFSPSNPDAESTLDVQYGGAAAVDTQVWFWTSTGWMYEFATNIFAAKSRPWVVSMSWGWPEPFQCAQGIGSCTSGETSLDYVNRVNTEFAKLGLLGVTLAASSGDQGAPGDSDPSCSNRTAPLSTIFPGASPYVLSVGATMLQLEKTSTAAAAEPPVCRNYTCATTIVEEVCTYPRALITTGGGFSDFSARPKWQEEVVSAYLKSGVKLPDSKFFNAENRGFPDVSALGHNYLIYLGGQFEAVDGTSCSSPVVGGIISLLNSYRFDNKKSSLGFVIPLMYAAQAENPAIFNDITTGNNKCTEDCCDTEGYYSAKGWDPVTGLGTPNYPALLAYVQKLN